MFRVKGPVHLAILAKLEEKIQEAEQKFESGKQALEDELKSKKAQLLESIVSDIVK